MSKLIYYPAGTMIIATTAGGNHYHLALEGFRYFGLTTDFATLRVKVFYLGSLVTWNMAFFPQYKYDFLIPED